MLRTIAVLLVLSGCGGSYSPLPDGGPGPDSGIPQPDGGGGPLPDGGTGSVNYDVTLSWGVGSGACGLTAQSCSGAEGGLTPAQMNALAAEYANVPGCREDTSSYDTVYISCDCVRSPCGSNQEAWTCPSVPHTGPNCTWTP